MTKIFEQLLCFFCTSFSFCLSCWGFCILLFQLFKFVIVRFQKNGRKKERKKKDADFEANIKFMGEKKKKSKSNNHTFAISLCKCSMMALVPRLLVVSIASGFSCLMASSTSSRDSRFNWTKNHPKQSKSNQIKKMIARKANS